MRRQSALARKQEARVPRARLRARLRLIKTSLETCEVTVIHVSGDSRFELHRELKAGRCRWFAVAVIDGELHDARCTRYRWQALALCREWGRA